ncbi:MAG: glycine cleavage system aminomethyltransferase GcvT [Schleiferiaceae bacterium]|nr:glycine cleavage system aminomethyltransferase GcvT [Schleiferiaceae bacterium]
MDAENLIKKLPLDSIHRSIGGKMIPFAGYEMPIQYDGVTLEHLAVRKNVGVFDVSHMGEFYVKGPDAIDFLQFVTSNDVSKLAPGKIQYTCFPNTSGGIVDDLLLYCIDIESYLLVVNASNISKDWSWLKRNKGSYNIQLMNSSDNISLFAVQGPNATKALETLTTMKLSDLSYYTFEVGEFCGVPEVLVSATGYTGSGGYEIYVPNDFAELIWKSIFEGGQTLGIKPIGLGARDTLRLEMGYCLYGNDIDDYTSPIEAGLSWITKFSKNFINSNSLKVQKEYGVSKKLVAFQLVDRGVPRQGYKISDNSGGEIGVVTSGTMSPSLGKAIGLGYVPYEKSKIGSDIFIVVRKKHLLAKIVSLPFWKEEKL